MDSSFPIMIFSTGSENRLFVIIRQENTKLHISAAKEYYDEIGSSISIILESQMSCAGNY